MQAPGGFVAPMRAALAVSAASIALGVAAPCLARSITIEDYAVAIDIHASGAFDITETIRLRFEGQWNGIHRRIPVAYTTAQGYAYNLHIALEGVTDETGATLRHQRSRDRHYDALKIFVPGASDASRTVVIRYTVRRGLRFFPDHDELYWNVTGDEWAFPIAAARARITLPRELMNVRANAFTGAFGSRERAAAITVDGIGRPADDDFAPASESPAPSSDRHVVEIEATRPLGIREGLTAAVAWNPGVVHRPGPLAAWLAWLWDNLLPAGLFTGLVAAPCLAFGILLRRWLEFGRDPRPGPLVVRYEPPEGLGPAEVGTLIDHSPDTRDLMAMLVDLAVKGYVRIRETAKSGWLSRARYAFDLLVPEPRWSDLPGSEKAFLRALFQWRLSAPDGKPAAEDHVVCSVTSDSLENRFYKGLPGIRTAIFQQLVDDRHYYERPDHVVSRHAGAAVIAAVAILGAAFAVNVLSPRMPPGMALGLGIFSAITTAAVIGGFGLVMPARTRRGAAARDAILGFEEFLSRVEAHRLATVPLTPDLFEKYLPYAMALGVEGRWSRAFEGICTETPRWYSGSTSGDTFDVADFMGDVSHMAAVTSSAMQSAPRSSEGSGFGGGGSSGGGSGGGFSGGGFGGGGGSGF